MSGLLEIIRTGLNRYRRTNRHHFGKLFERVHYTIRWLAQRFLLLWDRFDRLVHCLVLIGLQQPKFSSIHLERGARVFKTVYRKSRKKEGKKLLYSYLYDSRQCFSVFQRPQTTFFTDFGMKKLKMKFRFQILMKTAVVPRDIFDARVNGPKSSNSEIRVKYFLHK